MANYSDTTDSSYVDTEEDDQVIYDRAPPINPLEQAFREAITRVCFLGAEAARVREILRALPEDLLFERSFYTKQWDIIVHYHRLWCNELNRTSAEYLRAIMII